MSAQFSDLRVGDKVRLSRRNSCEDDPTFMEGRVVAVVPRGVRLDGMNSTCAEREWDAYLLERPIAVPTRAGYYLTRDESGRLDAGIRPTRMYRLNRRGWWYMFTASGATGWTQVAPNDLPEDMVRLVADPTEGEEL